MEFQLSPLFEEFEAIRLSGPKPVRFIYSAIIHTPTEDYEVIKVNTIDNTRDYQKNIGDEMILEVSVPLGVYAKLIHPNRYNLDITITRTYIGEVTIDELKEIQAEQERLKAVLVLDGLPPIEGTEIDKLDRDTLDLSNILKISFQLFNRSLEKLRLVTLGTVLRDESNEDIIKSMLTIESLKVTVEGEPTITGTDVVEADNTEKRKQTIIPQGTKLLNLPSYLHIKNGGVYNSDIGTYLQNKIWYVYPLFNTTRLSKETRVLTVFKVPKNFSSGTERTYRVEGDALFVIATSNSVFKDDGGTGFMNEGNGVRFADAGKFLESPVTVKDNKAIFNRDKLNYGFMSGDNQDGNNNIQISNAAISSNAFIEYSKLAGRGGGIYEFVWENSKPNLLFPGMMVKIRYVDKDDLVELHGVLLYVHTFIESKEPGFVKGRYTSLSHLAIYVNKPRKL